jgi:hypothetical protein
LSDLQRLSTIAVAIAWAFNYELRASFWLILSLTKCHNFCQPNASEIVLPINCHKYSESHSLDPSETSSCSQSRSHFSPSKQVTTDCSEWLYIGTRAMPERSGEVGQGRLKAEGVPMHVLCDDFPSWFRMVESPNFPKGQNRKYLYR